MENNIHNKTYNKLFKYITAEKSAASIGLQKAQPFNKALCLFS